ncbi:heme NO-binding domain-containing protein [Tropicibacter naphthalenivorans]|uniref:Heme NO binding protein n=1 Tax=Tropicibacter naphthalenivorans TaxID=441103 RepID=A0A0P1GKD5_9RHOB|nr:heme NO-binding domain-containing protein [Tropicibacter naphthalenivorans]CUH82458.1 Heme NO binding protein [Tropicibacter naphthalenivorans]SMD06008.1 Haem-NO-binding [Tropicibacter naphthalenivorans]
MHGLILRTLQVFVQDTYGSEIWGKIADQADLMEPDFEAMLNYDEQIYFELLSAAQHVLAKPPEALLEDCGTYLVSHPNSEGLRRLLRFGGVDFIEFLHSLDDLPDRARLAVADLALPDLELRDHASAQFQLKISKGLPGFGYVMVGLLRAMADDYGALVLLDYDGTLRSMNLIEISVVETAYAAGRDFELAANATPGGAA